MRRHAHGHGSNDYSHLHHLHGNDNIIYCTIDEAIKRGLNILILRSSLKKNVQYFHCNKPKKHSSLVGIEFHAATLVLVVDRSCNCSDTRLKLFLLILVATDAAL